MADGGPQCLEQRLVINYDPQDQRSLPPSPNISNASFKGSYASNSTQDLLDSPFIPEAKSSWRPIERIRSIVLSSSDDPYNFVRSVHWWPLRFRSDTLERAFNANSRTSNIFILFWQTIIALLVWFVKIAMEITLLKRPNFHQTPSWLVAKFTIYAWAIFTQVISLMLFLTTRELPVLWYSILLMSNIAIQNIYVILRARLLPHQDTILTFVNDSIFHVAVKFFTLASALIFVNSSSLFSHRQTFAFDILTIVLLSYLSAAISYCLPSEPVSSPRFLRASSELQEMLIVVYIFGHYLRELDGRAAFLDRTGLRLTLQKYEAPVEFYLEPGKSMAETLIAKLAKTKSLCHDTDSPEIRLTSSRKIHIIINDLQQMIDVLTKLGQSNESSTVFLAHLTDEERRSFMLAGINTDALIVTDNTQRSLPPRIEKRILMASPDSVYLSDIKTKYIFNWPSNVDIGLDLSLNLTALIKRSTALAMETARILLNRYGCKTLDHRKIYQIIIGIAMISPENPYSNVFRTVQATHILFYLLEYYEISKLLSDDEIATLLVASFGRFVGHGGTHANFYTATNNRLATLFNDNHCQESVASFSLVRMLMWPECRWFEDSESGKIDDMIHELLASLYEPDHFLRISRCRLRLTSGRLNPETNRDDLLLLLTTFFRISNFTKEWTLDKDLRRVLWFASRQELYLQFSTERRSLMEYKNNLVDHGDWFSQAGQSSYVKNVIAPIVDLLTILKPRISGSHTILGTIKDLLMLQECWPLPAPAVIQQCRISGTSFPVFVLKCILDSENLNQLIFEQSRVLDYLLAKQPNTCITRGLAVRNALHLGEEDISSEPGLESGGPG